MRDDTDFSIIFFEIVFFIPLLNELETLIIYLSIIVYRFVNVSA